jgi:hypothetical protein
MITRRKKTSERGLLDPGAHAARPDVLSDWPEPHPLVDELLDLVQHRFSLAAIADERLLLEQRIDVGIAAIGVGARARNMLGHPRRGIAVDRVRIDADPAKPLRQQCREVGGRAPSAATSTTWGIVRSRA